MAECMLDTCNVAVKGRRYCCNDCKATARQRRENPEPPLDRYKEVEPDVELLKHGAWLMFRSSFADEQCIGDFMRAFERAPKHVIYDPATPMWKYAGPVWTTEEEKWRWKGYETS